MLSKSFFDRELVVLYEGTDYEVIRPLQHPMILFDNTTGQAVASLHFVADACKTFITAHQSGFQGVVELDKQPIALVLTNLLWSGEVSITVTHRGTGALVNEVNVFRPGESVKVSGDYSAANKRLHLDAQQSGLTVAQDEARVGGPTGAYFDVVVVPARACGLDLRAAKWTCADLICRPRAIPSLISANRRGNEPFVPMIPQPNPFSFHPAFGAPVPTHAVQPVIDWRESAPASRGGFVSDGAFGSFGRGFGAASPSFSPSSPSYSAASSPARSFGAQPAAAPLPTFSAASFAGFSDSEMEALSFGAIAPHQSPSYLITQRRGSSSHASLARAANVRHGTETVHVRAQDVSNDDDVFAYASASAPVSLCLSVIQSGVDMNLPQLSKAAAFQRSLDLVHDTVVGKNKRLLESLGRIHVPSEECVVCMECAPNVVYVKCGHKGVCDGCTRKLAEPVCPLCRAVIVAKIHV
jgi:hypothetical protein